MSETGDNDEELSSQVGKIVEAAYQRQFDEVSQIVRDFPKVAVGVQEGFRDKTLVSYLMEKLRDMTELDFDYAFGDYDEEEEESSSSSDSGDDSDGEQETSLRTTNLPPSWSTLEEPAVNSEKEVDDKWNTEIEQAFEAVKVALEAWPEAIHDVDKEGRTMLHRAYEYRAPDSIVDLFQQMAPEMNDSRDSFGHLPHDHLRAKNLRLAVYKRQWAQFLTILDENPELALVRFSSSVLYKYDGSRSAESVPDTFLHLFVRRWCEDRQRIPYAVFQSLLSKCPDLVKTNNGSCGLPLSVALERDADTETILELLRHYPEGANVTGMWGLPIELAIDRKDGSVEVLAAISKASTKIALEERRAISLLTRAVERDSYVHEAVMTILKTVPAIVTQTNLDGDYPLFSLFERFGTLDVFGEILDLYPDLLTLKDRNGKSLLHVAYENNAPAPTIEKVTKLRPNLASEKDHYGRLPKDMQSSVSDEIFIAAKSCLLFTTEQGTDSFMLPSPLTENEEKEDTGHVVVPFKNYLMRDPSSDQKDDMIKWNTNFGVYFNDQLKARETLFRKLIDEFSELVEISDTKVIQRAATLQALACPHLSNGDDTHVDLNAFKGEAYWYQQEILKLVMRVYNEDESAYNDLEMPAAIFSDGSVCVEALDKSWLHRPSDDREFCFSFLFIWLIDDLPTEVQDDVDMAGPVRKSLQSLFNKLYIRRGQTKVKIIGDATRATIFIDDKEALDKVRKRIEKHFPNILPGKLQSADKLGVNGFMEYISKQPKLPDTNIIPYRFKPNGSQKKHNADDPLWFNLNFFDGIPEYHRSGNSDIFVAYELQIGLTEEINKHRKSHVAYERDRILEGQPCLKNFIEASEKIVQNQQDLAIIDNVLEGNIAKTVLSQENEVVFKHESTEREIETEDESSKRLCLNNKQFNMMKTQMLAGPFKLDPSKLYYIHSLSCDFNEKFKGSVGLYAHLGPYRVEVALGTKPQFLSPYPHLSAQNRRFRVKNIVKPGNNYAYFERVCSIPPGSTAVDLSATGSENKCLNMELVLKEFAPQT